jgi:hypothetical protein
LAPVLASIHGRLFDIEDRPLQNAEILALAEISAEEARRLQDLGCSQVSPGSLTVKATSNEHGNFAISGALPTSWHVYVFGDAHVGCWPPIVRLEPGEDKEVSPQLCMTYALSGTISDATTGTPIRGAQVLLGGDAASHMLEARIEDGVFSFPADTAGRYAIGEGIVVSRARDTDPLGVVASAPGYAAKLELVRGETFVDRQAGLDFALESEYRALVRVRDPAGQPVEGVQFWLDNYELFFAWRGWRTDASGRAVIGHLSPKRYRIGLRHDAFHSREVILEEGRPREVDLDAVLEPKSGIEAVIPDSLTPHWIFYGMLVGDRVTRRACLGGQEPLRSAIRHPRASTPTGNLSGLARGRGEEKALGNIPPRAQRRDDQGPLSHLRSHVHAADRASARNR